MISKYARGWSNSHKHPQAMTLEQLKCSHPISEIINRVSSFAKTKCMFCGYISTTKMAWDKIIEANQNV